MKKTGKRLFVTLCISLIAVCFQAVHADAESGTVVNVKVGNKSFECEFYDNRAANALLETIPVKYKMSELNGNEKYKYLDRDFPTDEKKVRRINAGDIMLYGSDCLVLFYRSFNTSYEYTPVGRITDPKGLKKAAGRGKVIVKFSKKKTIRLTETSLTLDPGQSQTIKLTGVNAKKVKWSTSNKKIAKVSKGKIRAKKPGTVTITAKYRKKKYRCKVIVQPV